MSQQVNIGLSHGRVVLYVGYFSSGMINSHSSHSSLLEEASSVKTSPQRLQHLLQADPSLGAVIATNPSASIQLLDQLALHYPVEVLANPFAALRAVEAAGAYTGFSLRSLVCLCVACEATMDNSLLNELKRRMTEAFDRLRRQESITLSCVWLFQRTFILQPSDCNGLIDEKLELSLECRAFVDGEAGDISNAIPPLACDGTGLADDQRARLASFLKAIDSGKLNPFIDSQIDSDGDREHKGDSRTSLAMHNTPSNYSIDGSLLCKDNEPILEFHALIHEFDSISYKDGAVWVAVGEHEEVDRDYYLSLGELEQLHALVDQSGHIPDDWHSRLAICLAS